MTGATDGFLRPDFVARGCAWPFCSGACEPLPFVSAATGFALAACAFFGSFTLALLGFFSEILIACFLAGLDIPVRSLRTNPDPAQKTRRARRKAAQYQ